MNEYQKLQSAVTFKGELTLQSHFASQKEYYSVCENSYIMSLVLLKGAFSCLMKKLQWRQQGYRHLDLSSTQFYWKDCLKTFELERCRHWPGREDSIENMPSSCIMGTVGFSVFGALPIIRPKSQDIRASFYHSFFFFNQSLANPPDSQYKSTHLNIHLDQSCYMTLH